MENTILNISIRNLYIAIIIILTLTVSSGCQFDFPSCFKYSNKNKQINSLKSITSSFSRMEFARLYGVGETVLQDRNIQLSLIANSKGDIEKAIEKYWLNMQQVIGIETYAIYDGNFNLITSSGKSSVPRKLLENMTPKAHSMNWAVSCNQTCQIYAAMPYVQSHKVEGILVLSGSYLDVIINLKLLYSSQYEFALVVSPEQELLKDKRYIASWQSNVKAATGRENTFEILRQISKTISLEDLVERGYAVIDINGKQVNVLAIPLFDSIGDKPFIIAISEE